MDAITQVKEKILNLQAALLAATPNMPVLLRDIHSSLKKDPECVTLLGEDEILTIVNGLKRQTNTEAAVGAIKSAKSKTSKAETAKLGLDDF